MSAVPADVFVTREPFDEALDPRHTLSKLSLACDALSNDKEHAAKSTKSYLDALLNVLNNFHVVQPREGAFDARVLATVDASRSFVDEYRRLMSIIASSEKSESYSPQVIAFLEGVLDLKKNYPIQETAAYLWRDALGFISRELYLATVRPLLLQSRWVFVKQLLQHNYAVSGSEKTFRYTAFDSFQRSLDVFRNRRLQLQRLSVSADVLKDRVEESAIDFEGIMQTDFFLHVNSLLDGHDPMHAWRARTLGHASEQVVSGFELFVSARAGKIDAGLKQVLNVTDWTQLQGKLESALLKSNAGVSDSIDYAGFVAANNTIFDH